MWQVQRRLTTTQLSVLDRLMVLQWGQTLETECRAMHSEAVPSWGYKLLQVSRKLRLVWARDPGKKTFAEEQPSELILETRMFFTGQVGERAFYGANRNVWDRSLVWLHQRMNESIQWWRGPRDGLEVGCSRP